MAKKVVKLLKLVIPAGQANPGPPLGPILSQAGVNIKQFTDQFNTQTRQMAGTKLRVIVKIYADRSYSFEVKTPPTSELIKQKAKIKKGSGVPNLKKVGQLTSQDLEEIAKMKLEDFNTTDLEKAKNIVAGTAKQMGIKIIE